jgi:hypothetical protein
VTVLPHLGNGVFGIASRMGIAVARTRLSPRMLLVIEVLADDWRRLDQRIDGLSGEIEARPVISSVMVASIGTGDVFSRSPKAATSVPCLQR